MQTFSADIVPCAKIENLVNIPDTVAHTAGFAFAAMLQNHGFSDKGMQLIFCSELENDAVAGTSLDGNTIAFDMESEGMQGWITSFGIYPAMLLLGGYEGMRAVHVRIGDTPPPSYSLTDEQQANETHHIQAWQESLALLKAIRPDTIVRISFPEQNKQYVTPEHTCYKVNSLSLPEYITIKLNEPVL